MVHLVWEGVSTDCIRQNLEILSCIPEVGHLITYCHVTYIQLTMTMTMRVAYLQMSTLKVTSMLGF